MKLLQVDRLSDGAIKSISLSFDNLPQTDHKDGKFRLRRYSVVELQRGAKLTRLPHRKFLQSERLNEHQGGVVRDFEEIEDEVLESEGMKEICLTFKHANNLMDRQEIEIHQMRIVTLEDGTAEPSPEGIHQDGFDYIAMVAVSRHNIDGGELMALDNPGFEEAVKPVLEGETKEDVDTILEALEALEESKRPTMPLFMKKMAPGEMITLSDVFLWHNARPIRAVDVEKQGYADWFILCALTNY